MFNAGSLMNKLDELNNLASLNHIDVIGVTETWLHDELKDHEVSLQGYALFRHDRLSSKRGGGVALYVKSNLRPQLITPTVPTPSPLFVNLIACELLKNTDPTVLVLAYRSPNTPPTDTTTFLCSLTKLVTHRPDCLLFGDFNCPKTDWPAYSAPQIPPTPSS